MSERAFSLDLDTMDHLFEVVAKNVSICPNDICGFVKASASRAWRRAHLRPEERAGDVSGFRWDCCCLQLIVYTCVNS